MTKAHCKPMWLNWQSSWFVISRLSVRVRSSAFQFNIAAGWSSLEARRAHNPKVTGSNPVPATYAQIAQLVEQRTENPRVAGSIPALGISFRKAYSKRNTVTNSDGVLAQSVEHLTFNQVVRGSNPRCLTKKGMWKNSMSFSHLRFCAYCV